METKNLLKFENLNLTPTEKIYYLEKVILSGLKEIVKDSNQLFIMEPMLKTNLNKTLVLDAVIPNGILDLKGPVLIEIKNLFNYGDIQKLINLVSELDKELHFQTFLLCIGVEVDDKSKMKIYSLKDKFKLRDFEIVIWDIKDIERNLGISKFYNSSNKFTDLDSLDFMLINNQPEEFKKNSENNLGVLKDIYESEQITLFLGSGVSKDSGLPLWDELIGRLSSEVISNLMSLQYTEEKLLTKELSTLIGNSPLLSASYLERGFLNGLSNEKDRVSFNRNIHENLFSQFIKLDRDTLIFKIAEAMINSSASSGIKKVITYNYDDILQQSLNQISPDFKVQTIYNDQPKIADYFPVFHVHGFLPHKPDTYPNYDLDEQEIIFTEDSYYQLQNEPYSWRNLSQINAFREETVLMIGISLTDPNMRRLLMQTSQQTEKKHFILLQRYSDENSKNLEMLQPEVITKFLDIHHFILEENFKKLGVNVIWYDSHDEIKKILTEIFKSKVIL